VTKPILCSPNVQSHQILNQYNNQYNNRSKRKPIGTTTAVII